MRRELSFDGTPKRFLLLIQELDELFEKEYETRNIYALRTPYTFHESCDDYVYATFGDPYEDDAAICGTVKVLSMPGGKAKLVVEADDEYWPGIEKYWRLLEAQIGLLT